MAKKNKTRKSRSKRAGLVFPVGRTHKYLKKGRYAQRVGTTAPFIYQQCCNISPGKYRARRYCRRDNKKTRIIPYHLQLAVRNDEDLSQLLSGVIIPQGGVVPHIEEVLLSKKEKTGSSKKSGKR